MKYAFSPLKKNFRRKSHQSFAVKANLENYALMSSLSWIRESRNTGVSCRDSSNESSEDEDDCR